MYTRILHPYKDRFFDGEAVNSPPGRGKGWVNRAESSNYIFL
jgi:hypothetical protein